MTPDTSADIEQTPLTQTSSPRLLSLDFMRGLIMVLLMLEASGLYEQLYQEEGSGVFHAFMQQFFHHPWHGLRFWDLIQPGFMFIAGTALAYSLIRQQQKNMPWSQSFLKVLKRSGWLFFWGVLDYAVRPKGLSFELWDVLTQLSFTTLVTFLVFRWSLQSQFVFSLGLLLLTEVLYRFTAIPGFDQPFTDQHNFGNYVDLLLMNVINSGGWVAINCLPTTAHTLWGAMAGRLLLSNKPGLEKVKWLFVAGAAAFVTGYLLDFTITPIIKRIATSSFVLVSGGWCLLALAFLYWWIDIKNHRKYLFFFLVVGMNSLFIYLFFEIVGHRWFNEYIGAITGGLLQMAQVPASLIGIITSLVIFYLEWRMLLFLYRRGIFFKV
ncbi:Heparan-alpha-glucosaminide N-acetyltransferase [Adhaeribacter pallidiroseus]|uniref:Heparan-alpha-glucosaminide N-acetyltransferase n=2 Tax=Adhaeribacter pallidiroseus TaxID=2072847 RepID=A0A369QAU3_9BACT|nr:Heparan-alpha-glucosaminide N-acetyltransferase [Adhaeribacter pallidiroseus]